MNYSVILLLCAIVISCATLPPGPHATNGNGSTSPDGESLLIVAVDVGQGDATLLVTPRGYAVLIDAGPEESGASAILPELNDLGISALSLVLLSHYDADHIGGMSEVIAGEDGAVGTDDDWWPTDGIWDRGTVESPETAMYQTYAELTTLARQEIVPGQRFALDGVVIECIAANAAVYRDQVAEPLFTGEPLSENERSVGCLIRYGKFRYWTGGDLPGSADPEGHDIESALAPQIGPVNVLHLHHHGSKNSSGENFLAALAPQAAIISAGFHNHYDHPADEVLARLQAYHIDGYATETGDDSPWLNLKIVHGSVYMMVHSSGDFTINGTPYRSE